MTDAAETQSPSLSDRIAQSLGGETSSTELTALIGEAERERERLEGETEAARRASLNPRARAEAVTAARQACEACSFASERLLAALDHLRRALVRAEDREAEVERQ